MALSVTRSQIKWSGSNSILIASGGSSSSDVQSIDPTSIAGGLQVKLVGSGAGSAGDHAIIKILYSHGDPDADPDTSDEYDSPEHAVILRAVPLDAVPTAIVSIPVERTAKSFKVYVEVNTTSISVTASAQYSEQIST